MLSFDIADEQLKEDKEYKWIDGREGVICYITSSSEYQVFGGVDPSMRTFQCNSSLKVDFAIVV